jgi:hypothetical protein
MRLLGNVNRSQHEFIERLNTPDEANFELTGYVIKEENLEQFLSWSLQSTCHSMEWHFSGSNQMTVFSSRDQRIKHSLASERHQEMMSKFTAPKPRGIGSDEQIWKHMFILIENQCQSLFELYLNI